MIKSDRPDTTRSTHTRTHTSHNFSIQFPFDFPSLVFPQKMHLTWRWINWSAATNRFGRICEFSVFFFCCSRTRETVITKNKNVNRVFVWLNLPNIQNLGLLCSDRWLNSKRKSLSTTREHWMNPNWMRFVYIRNCSTGERWICFCYVYASALVLVCLLILCFFFLFIFFTLFVSSRVSNWALAMQNGAVWICLWAREKISADDTGARTRVCVYGSFSIVANRIEREKIGKSNWVLFQSGAHT